ncbi:MAG: hypothetical protein FWD23_06590 [Oscillospiraceae bacterium]|nr:hypothetical protein [Oscillospiraceae bacterium]
MNKFEQSFQNPDRRYAIFPIIHGGVAAPNTYEEKIDSLGYAGIVGNVPYGRGYPNDENEWKQTEQGFRSFVDKGMYTWIYDEKGYPSGSAGGAVIDENPEFVAEGLYCYEYWRTLNGPMHYRSDVPGDKLFRAMLLPLDGGEAIDATHFLNEKNTLHMEIPKGEYHLFMMSSRRLFDGTHAAESYSEPRDYISLNDKKATEAFISVTHDKYAERLSDEFGKGVLAFFTDEPSLISWNIRSGVYPIVPWHRDFPAEFMAAYGYPIELAVVAVVTKRGPAYVKRRCDFWEFVGESVAENFFGTIQNWCRAHGLKSSGHLLEEERLQAHVYNYGSLYKCVKRMDWPGIDQLDSEPQRLMNPHAIPIARLLASFADISGENESFTEFSDHSSRMENKQIGMNWIRSSVNWHYAMGINNLTSYYSFDNFSAEEITELNAYAARLGYLIRQGKRDSKVALFYPEAAIWAAYTPSVRERAVDTSEDTMRVNDTFAKASWELLHRQIDFDYVDEQLLLDGEIKDGRLRYRAREYECIVFPAVHVISIAAVDKMTAMLEAGIGIVLIGGFPLLARDTGADEGFYQKFSPYLGRKNFAVIPVATGWTLPGMNNIPAIPRPVTVWPHNLDSVLTGAAGAGGYVDGEIISENILSHTRVLEDGSRIIFLCNMGGKNYRGYLRVAGGNSVKTANPLTGLIEPVHAKAENGMVAADINLRPYDGFCYIVE